MSRPAARSDLPAAPPSPRTRFAVLTVTVLNLTVAFGVKIGCFGPVSTRPAVRLCYSDIVGLYFNRGIAQGKVPYLETFNEYPVLSGMFMWLVGVPTDSQRAYFLLSVIVLVAVTLGVSYLLVDLMGLRAMLWAGAPAITLYAFHNWDALAVFLVVLACWSLRRDRSLTASICFAASAAFKLYALALIPVLALWTLRRSRPSDALKVLVTGIGTFVLINLPMFVLAPKGWLRTYTFHSERIPNPDSIWMISPWSGDLSVGQINALSAALVVGSLVAISLWAWVKSERDHGFDLMAAMALVTVSLLLWGKVHSPQYALWLLPFFVLVPLSIWWWVAYAAADVGVYVEFFRYDERLGVPSPLTLDSAVALRHLVLLGLLIACARTIGSYRSTRIVPT